MHPTHDTGRYFDKLKAQWQQLRKMRKLASKARKHGRDLSLKQDNLQCIQTGDIILFSVMKDEAFRLPFFIDYYRKLGVDHFIFVDNNSSDNFDEVVAGQDDISTFFTEASYKQSLHGVHWLNHLLKRYGSGHWCLTCDPDEFLVYPYIEQRDLKQLTTYLASIQQVNCFTLMVDMYSQQSINSAVCEPGDDPLNACAYFDKQGYELHANGWHVHGGVRRRMFFADKPESSPALNKTPLVYWRKHYAYVASTHILTPSSLNPTFRAGQFSGALLHFKFLSSVYDKVEVEMQAQQHWGNSIEYKQYQNILNEDDACLYDPEISVRYENWQTLEALELVSRGSWQ